MLLSYQVGGKRETGLVGFPGLLWHHFSGSRHLEACRGVLTKNPG